MKKDGAKRFIIKKIYAIRFAILGLYVGIWSGLICAIVLYLMLSGAAYLAQSYDSYLSLAGISAASLLNQDSILKVSIAMFILNAAFFPMLFLSIANTYNLFAKLGGAIHLKLEEYVSTKEVPAKKK
jgi:TM2 domain-containing membrane protein YozV